MSQEQVIGLVASECNSFVEQFFSNNCGAFQGLESPNVMKTEQKPEWFNLFQQFEAEAELTMQNALMLWGLVQAKTFEEQFVEEAMHTQALDDFLSLTVPWKEPLKLIKVLVRLEGICFCSRYSMSRVKLI